MFNNVLVGVDGNSGGRDAIAFAARLVAPGASETLVHVRSSHAHSLRAAAGGHGGGLSEAGSLELLERERADAELGESVELSRIAAHSPGAGLHREAEVREADLLVVGSSSRGLLGRAALGDDTRAALNGSPCAVAIAARGYGEHPVPPSRVGVAYNGSAESEAALAAALAIAAPTRAEVIALEVVGIPNTPFLGFAPAAYAETVKELLAAGKERMAQLSSAQGRAEYGVPGEELAEFSGEVDVLVVGSRSYGPLKRLVLGSTSDYLERHARSALLVLPRPDQGATGASG
jgi:nucleotide-binding universal stress UspA family protein